MVKSMWTPLYNKCIWLELQILMLLLTMTVWRLFNSFGRCFSVSAWQSPCAQSRWMRFCQVGHVPYWINISQSDFRNRLKGLAQDWSLSNFLTNFPQVLAIIFLIKVGFRDRDRDKTSYSRINRRCWSRNTTQVKVHQEMWKILTGLHKVQTWIPLGWTGTPN